MEGVTSVRYSVLSHSEQLSPPSYRHLTQISSVPGYKSWCYSWTNA